jgi:hypothetical protein
MAMQQYGHGGRLPTDQRTNGAEVAIAWVITVCTLAYMLPWAVAATRGKSNSGGIALLNFFLGWTFIGWVCALVMAYGSHQVAPSTLHIQQIVAVGGPPPGWHPDPSGNGSQRYWDGQVWT